MTDDAERAVMVVIWGVGLVAARWFIHWVGLL